MSTIEIRAISAAETLPLRHAILRAGLPRETATFSGDEAATSQHFGAFLDGQLVGVATIHRAPVPDSAEHDGPAFQVRGMATTAAVRGRGAGRALLAACVLAAQDSGAHWIWCNARTPAAGFYARHGFRTTGNTFEIPTAGPHVRMLRAL